MPVHVHSNCLHMATREDGTPWWTAFPEPKSSPSSISPDEVYSMLESQQGQEQENNVSRSFLLIDVRRTDFHGGTISTSLNLPAHSFYYTRKSLYELCKQAGVKKIIFYCGQSNGRGPRCAAWMQDLIEEVRGEGGLQSLVLEGGIKGWVGRYAGGLVDGWEESAWATKA